jgi:hypothetical protein
MDRNVDIELARYRALNQYRPRPGDFVIRHGLFFPVKWFGVINYIDQIGGLHIIKRGHPRLLFMATPEEQKSNVIILPAGDITAVNGRYTVMQQDLPSNVPVWYV